MAVPPWGLDCRQGPGGLWGQFSLSIFFSIAFFNVKTTSLPKKLGIALHAFVLEIRAVEKSSYA
jgi:hypothetical protein